MQILKRLKRDKLTRNKLIFTILIMFGLLVGYRIPLPGINRDYLTYLSFLMDMNGVGGFIGALTGNSFEQMSIFALSVGPHITASILLQLLTIIVPKLQEISKDGTIGRQKMEKFTMIISAFVAAVQASAMAVGFGRNGLFVEYSWYMVVYATIVWTAGACFLVWVGQTITKKFIGNGVSLILLFNILSTMPSNITAIFNSIAGTSAWWIKVIAGIGIAVVFCLLFAFVVVMNTAEKRIRITNSGTSGFYTKSADENVMPLKLNAGGVMPVIFASSIMSLPAVIGSFFEIDASSTIGKLLMSLSQANWFRPECMIYSLGALVFAMLSFGFTYFYSVINFNTTDIANNLRRSGAVVNGIRPGQPTAEYLEKQAKSMLWISATMLITVALLPTLISGLCGIEGLSFGGTTIIIVVGVILEMKDILLGHTSSVAYRSLIKKR